MAICSDTLATPVKVLENSAAGQIPGQLLLEEQSPKTIVISFSGSFRKILPAWN